MQQLETTIDHLGPIASATLRASVVEPFEAFVAPGDVFRHPREVLTYPGLSTGEKRAILASWASDAHAVNSCPALPARVPDRAGLARYHPGRVAGPRRRAGRPARRHGQGAAALRVHTPCPLGRCVRDERLQLKWRGET
jgi:hypothetical protein